MKISKIQLYSIMGLGALAACLILALQSDSIFNVQLMASASIVISLVLIKTYKKIKINE